MAEEIVNRVARSPLITIDLEDYYPEGERIFFDLKDWLYEGLVLRESDFREKAKSFDWSVFNDKYVALGCSSDAIIPGWAYMLVSMYTEPYAKTTVIGDLQTLETLIYKDVIDNIDMAPFKGKPVIIKGCSEKAVPENAYVDLASRLKPYARSIQYGEACSSVPLYKAPKK